MADPTPLELPDGMTAVPALLPVDLYARLAVIAQRHGRQPAELLGWLIVQAADDQLSPAPGRS